MERIEILGALIEAHTGGPTVIPDTDNLEHVTPLQLKFISCTWLIRPQDGNFVVGMNVVL